MPNERVLPIQSVSLGGGVHVKDQDATQFYDGKVEPGKWRSGPYAHYNSPEQSGYIDADLGELCVISQVTVWHLLNTRYYSQTVEVSSDGTFGESGVDDHYRVVWTTGVGELGPVETTEGNTLRADPPARGRYVRHRCGKSEDRPGSHFIEMEVRGVLVAEAEAAAPSASGTTLAPWNGDDYGHVYWRTGWRKTPEDGTPDVLSFETGLYGLELFMADLTRARYGTLGDDEETRSTYTDALDMSKRDRMRKLGDKRDLTIELMVDGSTYRAKTCLAGATKTRSKARLWEAGRFVQNYELVGLVFENEGGETLAGCKADLVVVVWPRSFSMTLRVQTEDGVVWSEGACVKMEFGQWSVCNVYDSEWPAAEQRSTSLECHTVELNGGGEIEGVAIKMNGFSRPNIPVAYLPEFACYVSKLSDPARLFRGGYTDIRDYDKFDLSVENVGDDDAYVPFLFELKKPANPTGVVPILFDLDGNPTGIPVQLSKNWHNKEMGTYVRAYTLLPVPAQSSRSFELSFVYGFYGDLPSASHANLSLVGWSDTTNGKWDQLAIGCFGETHCLDTEFSATKHNIITDVRALMLRPGVKGKKWAWTNAGWGGDWLDAFDGKDRRVVPRAVKAAYISQGPCLTEAQYGGYYGGDGFANCASFLNTVRTLRTDDYARTFHSLRFDFQTPTSFRNRAGDQVCCLFRVGGCRWELLKAPRIAVGNAEGLIEEYQVPSDARVNTFFKEDVELTGPGPWWIAYPGMNMEAETTKGQGWRALIIQSCDMTIGEEVHDKPVVSFFVRNNRRNEGGPNVDALVRPPPGVEELKKGDRVAMDLYWITLPHNADDYYGPNAALRDHLEEKPDSWETVLREVRGNNLKVEVTGGEVKKIYPLFIRAPVENASEINVNITGGVGAVPVRFEGLDSGSYQLYKSSAEEDGECEATLADSSRQVNYDADTFTYSVTYNIVLDGMDTSSWVLKK